MVQLAHIIQHNPMENSVNSSTINPHFPIWASPNLTNAEVEFERGYTQVYVQRQSFFLWYFQASWKGNQTLS